MNNSFPTKVRIIEVGPRDGLQNEAAPISTPAKIAFIQALFDAGLRDIEAGAFVSPKWVPKMADSAEIFRSVVPPSDGRLFGLVPNEQGLKDALNAGCRNVAVFTAASETFSKKNTNSTIDESFTRFKAVAALARQEKITIRGYLSTCFFCPYEGHINPEKVVTLTRRMLDEVDTFEVSLGDTIGAATPGDVMRLLDLLIPHVSPDKLALHLHDTRSTALANVFVGLSYGISAFDASAGGLGGCPYAPGAAGNLATDDLLYLMRGMRIETGVDPTKLRDASHLLADALGRPLPSRVLQAGNPKE